MPDVKDLNPANYADHDDAENLTDRGDEHEEGEEEVDTTTEKKVTKKVVKKKVVEEEEEEGEEEEEEGEEEEGEEEEKDDRPDTRVPYKRFARQRDARVSAEERAAAAESKLAEIEANKSKAVRDSIQETTDKLNEMYEQVEEARAEGRTKDASKLQQQIDGIRDKLTRNQAAHFAAKAAVDESNLRVYNAQVRELEAYDPRFDKDSEEHDPDLVEEVSDLVEAYEARGMAAPEALRKAAKTVLREDPFAGGKARSLKKAQPRKTDVLGNLKAAKKQPAEEPSTLRERSGKIDVSKMSEKDFDALPESKIRQLRGDDLED